MEGQIVSSSIMEQDRWGRFVSDAERSADKLLEKLGVLMTQRARKHAPVRTGTLRRSIRPFKFSTREVRVGSNVSYARFHEEGTKGPYLIHGVKADFKWQKKGRRFIWNHYMFGPVGDGGASFVLKGGSMVRTAASTGAYQNWTYAHGATIVHPGIRNPSRFLSKAYDDVWPVARKIMRETYGGR